MRSLLLPVIVAMALLVGVAGSALANCGADHTGSTVNSPPPPTAPQA